jgi:hypothetical protein
MKSFFAKPSLNATFKVAQPLPLLPDISAREMPEDARTNRQIQEDIVSHVANLPLARQTHSSGFVRAEN